MKSSYFLLTAILIVVFAAVTPEIYAQTRRGKTVPKTRPKATPVKTATPAKAVESGPAELIPGAKDADGWTLYESKADLFSAAFPPTPVVTDEVDEKGRKLGSRYYNPEPVTPAKISLTMTVSDLGVTVADPAEKSELYNGWLQGLMSPDRSGKSGIKVFQKEFAVGNTFGMEVIVDRGDYRFHGRVVCVGSKFYQFAAGSGTPATITAEAYAEGEKWKKKFFDSFRLTANTTPDLSGQK